MIPLSWEMPPEKLPSQADYHSQFVGTIFLYYQLFNNMMSCKKISWVIIVMSQNGIT